MVVSELWLEVVVEDVEVVDGSLAEPLAGQPVVVPLVVVPGVVEPASTVGSVWVWVRPGGTFGAVFVPIFTAPVPACLASGLTCGLCWAVALALVAALCRWVTAATWSIRVWTTGDVVTLLAIVSGLGTEATGVAGAAPAA